MPNPRGIVLFEESIKSQYTAKNYNSHMRQFMRFTGTQSADMLLAVPSAHLQHQIEDYLIALKFTAHPNSIPSMFQGIRHFCIMNDININWDKIRRMFPARQKTQSFRSYTTREISMMLGAERNPKNRALVHFLASTGARIGVFDHPLLFKHTRIMPHGCHAVLLYAGTVEEYWSFLTPQACRALNEYHLCCPNFACTGGDIPLFGVGNTLKRQLGWNGARSAVYRIIQRSGISRSRKNGRYDVQADHGFRKRFNTILKLDNSVNYNIAEKLMGHRNGLDGTYLTPTVDELFSEFSKVIARLEI